MRVSERDWLILRGRLRAFVSAAALPVVIGSMAATVAADPREDDEQADRTARSLPEDGSARPREAAG